MWNLETQTDHLVPARRPDVILTNKKWLTCHSMVVAAPADHWIDLKENEKL